MFMNRKTEKDVNFLREMYIQCHLNKIAKKKKIYILNNRFKINMKWDGMEGQRYLEMSVQVKNEK